jgi:hypothetical protein
VVHRQHISALAPVEAGRTHSGRLEHCISAAHLQPQDGPTLRPCGLAGDVTYALKLPLRGCVGVQLCQVLGFRGRPQGTPGLLWLLQVAVADAEPQSGRPVLCKPPFTRLGVARCQEAGVRRQQAQCCQTCNDCSCCPCIDPYGHSEMQDRKSHTANGLRCLTTLPTRLPGTEWCFQGIRFLARDVQFGGPSNAVIGRSSMMR